MITTRVTRWIRDKYTAWGIPPDKIEAIEEVDHLWTGGSLLDVITERNSYDFIIASHVIEHTVDIISFLSDCRELLTESGRLALVVPDKRYCFDRFQPLSTIGDAVDAFHASNRFHTAGTLLDHQAYGCTLEEAVAWTDSSTGTVSLQFPQLAQAAQVIEAGLAQDEYHDIHHWKFTPTSFDLLARDLWLLGYLKLGQVGGAGTEGFEFFVTLGKDAGWPDVDRTELLLRVEAELAEPGLKDLRELHASLAAENDDLRRRVSELTAEVALMTGSRSWRMTAPLRRLSAARKRLVD